MGKIDSKFCSALLLCCLLVNLDPVCSIDLRLKSLQRCTFHLVHFYDLDWSEEVLHSSQFGQTWTVYNVSKMAAPKSRDTIVYPPPQFPSRESRICNVHL